MPEKMDYSEFIKDFIEEGEELLQKLNQDAVRLEKEPENIKLINDIFRSIHTLKATVGFLEITSAKDLLQATENLLVALRDGRLKITDEITGAIFSSIDTMQRVVDVVAKGSKEEIDVTPLVANLNELTKAGKPLREKRKLEKKEELPSEEKREVAPTMRVDTARIDSLMNLVGELITGRNRLIQVSRTLKSDDLSLATEFISNIISQLQAEMLQLRMVPIGRIFNRFPRLVRDLAHEMGKEINLVIEGEETGLDKTIIEEIYDPLVHLIRNSVSHGIELPDERQRKEKAKVGTIRIGAYQEQNFVIIEVEDDGQGIDGKVVLDSALKKGIITEEEASELSPEQVVKLIFRPGFSAVAEATEVSGRGVGLDVVKTNIERLNGLIDVQTEAGVGSHFIAKLPLTLAILSVLEVKISTETYAVPLPSVRETIALSPDAIKTVKGQEITSYRSEPLPLVRLDRVFNLKSLNLLSQSTEKQEAQDNPSPAPKEREELALILESVDERIGIIVDSLLGKEEIVIKPLGSYLGDLEGVAGTTVLGSGEVILILDVPSLFKLVRRESHVRVLQAKEPAITAEGSTGSRIGR